MTREEAIKVIKKVKRAAEIYESEDVEAYNMAIEALSQPNVGLGQWIDNLTRKDLCNCSNCNALSNVYFKYCPHCGAKMVEPRESEVE